MNDPLSPLNLRYDQFPDRPSHEVPMWVNLASKKLIFGALKHAKIGNFVIQN